MADARIVVVEDDEIISEHLQKILTELGYEVAAAAATGELAVEVVEKTRPDLVLMDIILKGPMDGIEAAERIRAGTNIPVIYLTAYSDDRILERAKITEPFGYLLKPFRKEALKTTVAMALYKSEMDRRLRESEAKYRELAELLPQTVYEIDGDGRFIFLNQAGLDSLGYSREDLPRGLYFRDTIAPEDRDRVLAGITKVMGGDRLLGEEFLASRKDGTVFPMVTYAHPLVRDRALVGVRGVAVDITERKQAEEALRQARDDLENRVLERTAELEATNERLRKEIAERRRAQDAAKESEQLFRAIFESARDAIFIKDLSLHYTLANPVMASLLNLPESDIVGLSDEDIFGEQAAAHTREVDARVLTGEAVEEEHTRPVRGANVTFHDIRVPLRDSRSQIMGLCGISRNITERRKATPAQVPVVTDHPSRAMRATLQKAQQAAGTDSIILLLGESGSGKDYLARWIHQHSRRVNGPFFAMNCAALPQELAESELFGHESGAFTGARGRVRGILELAEGGTLLLNEIGELPPIIQAKLLTFLDTRAFCRLGGRETIKVNARLIAATNRDIEKEVADGRFRGDLYHRINVFSMTVPPLRERIEDIPGLAREIVAQLAADLQLSGVPEITPSDMDRLCRYVWPGNVRELKNVLERALIVSGGKKLAVDSLSEDHTQESTWSRTVTFPPPVSFTDLIRDLRMGLIREALRTSEGNKAEAARILGISRYTLRRQMKSLGL